MSRHYLLNPSNSFYRANLHGHTVISDGETTPEQYANLYRQEGYSIVALTDHKRYRYHQDLNTDSFVCIAGYEEELNPAPVGNALIDREKKCYHLNVYDTRPWTRPEGYVPPQVPEEYHDRAALNQWIAVMEAEGHLICYNHPAWSMQDHRDYTGLQGLWAMEIYNHGCEVEGMYGAAPQVYDEMLRDNQHLFCVGTDDNHNHFPLSSQYSDSFGGFTMFNLPSLSYKHVVAGMRTGSFYASMGPRFHELSLEDGVLHIETSPVSRICVFTESRRVFIKSAYPGTSITHADFQLTRTEVYIRVQAQDAAGKCGFSRAYFRNELPG